MSQPEREEYAFASLVRRMAVSIWQAASVNDTERVMEESMSLAKQAADRMLKLEGKALPAEESDYDLTELREEFGEEGHEEA